MNFNDSVARGGPRHPQLRGAQGPRSAESLLKLGPRSLLFNNVNFSIKKTHIPDHNMGGGEGLRPCAPHTYICLGGAGPPLVPMVRPPPSVGLLALKIVASRLELQYFPITKLQAFPRSYKKNHFSISDACIPEIS